METITMLDVPESGDIAIALENLAEVFEFTIVERCPAPVCAACRRRDMPVAA